MPRRNNCPFGPIPFIVPMIVVAALGIAPFAAVVWHSLTLWNQAARGHFSSQFSLAAYRELMEPNRLIALRRILARGLAVASVGTVIAVPIAYVLIRRVGSLMRVALLSFITLPLLTSDVVRAFAWRSVLGPTGLLFSEVSVVVALVASVVSLTMLPVLRALESVNPLIWRASSEFSTSRWTEFRYIAFPLVTWAVSLGWLASCLIAVGSSVEVDVLAGTTKSSIGAEISGLFSAQKFEVVAAFSVTLIVSAAVVGILLSLSQQAFARKELASEMRNRVI